MASSSRPVVLASQGLSSAQLPYTALAPCTHRPGPRCCQWGRNAAGWWWRPGLALLVSCQFVEEPQSEQRPAAAAWCGAGAGRGADIEILEHTHSSPDELQCAALLWRYWQYAARGAEFCEALHRDTGTSATADTTDPARSFGKTWIFASIVIVQTAAVLC